MSLGDSDMAPRGKRCSYSQDPLAKLGIFFLVGLSTFSVLTKNWQISSSTRSARQTTAGMQVFSDSFRDTNVKMDPGMESQVPEAPWAPKRSRSSGLSSLGCPAQVLPVSTPRGHILN